MFAMVHGRFCLSAAKAGFGATMQFAAREALPRMLLDCTRVTGEMTVNDRRELGMFLADEQSRHLSRLPGGPRIAILAAPPIMDPSRFTQTVANNRGVRMRASESLQELISWLEI